MSILPGYIRAKICMHAVSVRQGSVVSIFGYSLVHAQQKPRVRRGRVPRPPLFSAQTARAFFCRRVTGKADRNTERQVEQRTKDHRTEDLSNQHKLDTSSPALGYAFFVRFAEAKN